MFLKRMISTFTGNYSEQIKKLKQEIKAANAIVIGAGAGLSAAAGFTYSGERFYRYFADLEKLYGFHDMYSGGFYAYPSQEAMWAMWSRNIYINRYMNPPKPVYEDILSLVRDKEYFVITTNVDHCFQKAGIDKNQLFYTQGDYGLFQCSEPCHQKTYDNRDTIRKMVLAQGFHIAGDGSLSSLDETPGVKTEIPTQLIPHCPVCGKPMGFNLRSDDTFVQDSGWYKAGQRYQDFLQEYTGKQIVYLELGVGGNTPGIIKYPFWQMTYQNPKATYACINYGDTAAPREIAEQSICIDGDIGEVLKKLK